MGRKLVPTKIHKLQHLLLSAAAGVLAAASFVPFGGRAFAAACTAPTVDYGKATTSLTVPASASYRIWTRIMVPDTTNTSYLLQVDGATCYNVGGGSSIPANTWTWVDYQGGNTASKVQQSLTQGAHSLVLIGNAPGVKVDRIVAVSDTTCVPTGLGDNCNVPTDTTAPTVTLTAPAEAASVSGTVTLSATASDNVGVTKVEFYDNSTLVSTDTSSPYSASWNSAGAQNGSHLISARAYDAAGNVSSDSHTVTVANGDTQVPTAPTGLSAKATAYNAVSLSWTASTDNVGVTGYNIIRNGVPVAKVGAVTSYGDTGLSANTSYMYQVQAFDDAGNTSPASSQVSVTTPQIPDTTPPAAPTNVTATAVSSNQVNLSWTASTDNVGVTGYDILRAPGTSGGTFAVVGSSTTTSFADTGLTASTSYRYQVRAKDAAGNLSAVSNTVTVTTLPGGGTGGCSATATVQTQWGNGYVMDPVTVKNTGTSSITGWTVTFTLPAGHTISGSWNGTVSVSGQNVTVKPVGWNAAVAPGASVAFGFQVSRPNGDTALASGFSCTTP